jgi:predicted RNA binding protein YcfA (HicA-like mRNA interferase family)
MPKLPIVKARELIRVITKLGFFEHHRVGSHVQFKNKDGRRVTVSIHKGKDIKKKTLRGIISDLEISVEEFTKKLKK